MDAMNEQDNIVIQKKYVRLAKTLEAQNLLGFLYQEGVLSDHDKEKIGALQSTSEEKAEKLLDILKKRKDGLKMLIKALLVSRVQGFLGNELLECVTWSEEEMGTFKLELEGKIDQQQMLEANMAALKQEIHQLKAKDEESQQKLEANMAALKQENNQLKAKDEESQKTIKDLTERIEQLTQEKEANGGDARRQAKLSRTHAFVHTCNGKHRRSVSETR